MTGSVDAVVQNENGNRVPFLEILPATLSLRRDGVKREKVRGRAKKGIQWSKLWEREEEKKKKKRALVAVFATLAIAAAVGREAMLVNGTGSDVPSCGYLRTLLS